MNCLITFRSVTPAQRGEALLRHSGFYCTLQRTPKRMQQQGCGYCLRLKENDTEPAVTLLRENEIPYGKVYRLSTDGTAREWHI